MSVAQRIREQYPSLAFLVSHPEIGPLLKDAVDPNKGFSPQTFQAKLYQTSWWRNSSANTRSWLIKQQTDPGTARNERATYSAELRKAAAQYGAKLSSDQLKWMTEVGLARGWDPSGTQMLNSIAKLVNTGKANTWGVTGARQSSAISVREMARREFLDPMSNKKASRYGDQIARGVRTIDDVRKELANRALVRFPQFAGGLRQGYTMADLTDHYRQTIGEELDIDPDRIDLSHGQWSKVLSKRDGNKVRPMSQFEALQLARQDPRFWRTQKGQQMDADWSGTMLQMFGKRAPMGGGR